MTGRLVIIKKSPLALKKRLTSWGQIDNVSGFSPAERRGTINIKSENIRELV